MLFVTGSGFIGDDLILDGNSQASIGLDAVGATNGVVRNLVARNFTQSEGATAVARALSLRNASHNWQVLASRITDVSAPITDVARGIWVDGSAATAVPKNIQIIGGTIERISPLADADGIQIQANAALEDRRSFSLIHGVTFVDCHKRAIKVQAQDVSVIGCFIRSSESVPMHTAIALYNGKTIVRDCVIRIHHGGNNGSVLVLSNEDSTEADFYTHIQNNYVEVLSSATGNTFGVRDETAANPQRNVRITGNTFKNTVGIWFNSTLTLGEVSRNVIVDFATGFAAVRFSSAITDVVVNGNTSINGPRGITVSNEAPTTRCAFTNNRGENLTFFNISSAIVGSPEIWGNDAPGTDAPNRAKRPTTFVGRTTHEQGSLNNDDVEVTTAARGFVSRSANGKRWRIRVNDNGDLTITELT